MPTDDKLDAETEGRIRAACLADHPSKAGWKSAPCTCPIQRAAIRADREARETKLRCEAVMCSGCDAMLDVTLMHATVYGDVGAFIMQTEPGKLPDEIAYADRLAEALKLTRALLFQAQAYLGYRGGPLTQPAVTVALRDAESILREHKERRR